jgi:hypothetical protein
MRFELNEKQMDTLDKWVDSQSATAVANQKANPPTDVPLDILETCWDMGYPYGGAIGGSLTYSFTPTSVGVAIDVTCSHTQQTIDLSDYEDW